MFVCVSYMKYAAAVQSYGDKPNSFLSKVPGGLLPVIELDGCVVTESADIMFLLEKVLVSALIGIVYARPSCNALVLTCGRLQALYVTTAILQSLCQDGQRAPPPPECCHRSDVIISASCLVCC
jgi:Glutathione S-transferase, N-terminal domain